MTDSARDRSPPAVSSAVVSRSARPTRASLPSAPASLPPSAANEASSRSSRWRREIVAAPAGDRHHQRGESLHERAVGSAPSSSTLLQTRRLPAGNCAQALPSSGQHSTLTPSRRDLQTPVPDRRRGRRQPADAVAGSHRVGAELGGLAGLDHPAAGRHRAPGSASISSCTQASNRPPTTLAPSVSRRQPGERRNRHAPHHARRRRR